MTVSTWLIISYMFLTSATIHSNDVIYNLPVQVNEASALIECHTDPSCTFVLDGVGLSANNIKRAEWVK